MKTKSFKIEQTFLKHLREKLKLSQEALALNALTDGNISLLTDQKKKSLLRMYQKIERDGKTSFERAAKIAKALNVSVSQLQNPPTSLEVRKAELTALIKSCVETEKAAGDIERLQRFAQDILNYTVVHCSGGDANAREESEIETMAKKIFELAERHYLSGDIEKLQPIADFLDISVEWLKPSVQIKSYWWFSGGYRSEFSPGRVIEDDSIFGLIDAIEKSWEKCDSVLYGGNYKAVVTKKGLKYHLAVQDRNSDVHWSCEFCMCNVITDDGILWIEPSEWERQVLMKQLQRFLFNQADCVVINGLQFPPENTKFVWNVEFNEFKTHWELSSKTTGEILGDRQFLYSGQRRDGRTRIFDDYFDFYYSLLSFINKHDKDNWKFEPNFEATVPRYIDLGGVDIRLSTSNEYKSYTIHLGWLDDNGKFHEAPWEKKSRANLIKLCKGEQITGYYGICKEEQRTANSGKDYEKLEDIPPFEPDVNLQPLMEA